MNWVKCKKLFSGIRKGIERHAPPQDFTIWIGNLESGKELKEEFKLTAEPAGIVNLESGKELKGQHLVNNPLGFGVSPGIRKGIESVGDSLHEPAVRELHWNPERN